MLFNSEYTLKLCDAVRSIEPEISESTDITLGFAMVFEALQEKIQRLEERISNLEPYEED